MLVMENYSVIAWEMDYMEMMMEGKLFLILKSWVEKSVLFGFIVDDSATHNNSRQKK